MKNQANKKGKEESKTERKGIGKRKGKRDGKGKGHKIRLLNDTDREVFFKLIQMS